MTPTKQLKQLAIAFVVLGLFATSLDNVFAPGLEAFRAERAQWLHDLFQTVARGGFIVLGTLLMLKLYGATHKLRRNSIKGFLVASVLLLVFVPLLTGFNDIVFLVMPFPWTTMPLQLLYDGHYLAQDYRGYFGGNGVPIILGLYAAVQVGIFSLVAFKGKRFYCSYLCLHAGVHAETMSEALPLIGDFSKGRDKLSPYLKNTWLILKVVLLLMNAGLMLLWVPLALGWHFVDPSLMRVIEGVKLIGLEFALFFFWFLVATARGYCFYCPGGTVLSMWSRLFKHRLVTDLQVCVACGQCNKNCEMGISVMARAKKQRPVLNPLCVGCGHCVDMCPTKTLDLE